MNNILDYLKNKQLVWQGQLQDTERSRCSSGHPILDEALHDGLPEQGVIDVQSIRGIGEFRLFTDYLLQRQQQQRLLVFIASPMQINAEMLAETGLILEHILVLNVTDHKQALWAAEQCLKSGCCHTVISWQQQLEVAQAKRLQLAAKQGEAVHIMLRQPRPNNISLPVTLAMRLSSEPSGVNVKIDKQVGGWQQKAIKVELNRKWPALSVPKPNNVLPFPHQHVG